MTGDSAVQLLKLASKSANMIPPVKNIVDGALRIGELVLQFKTSQDEWKEFQTYVQNAVATVLHLLASIDSPQSEAKGKLEKLQSTLEGIVKRIEANRSESLAVRMFRFLEHATVIADMKAEVDEAVSLFKLGATIRTEISIERALELLQQIYKARKEDLKFLGQWLNQRIWLAETTTTTLNPTLSKLRRVEGASWHPYRGCLEHTRQNIIETILSWLNNSDGAGNSKGIFLLTGVAGSGKSAIAHTVARRCHGNRQLATSFFFDRDTSDRNNPKHLITTIAANLCLMGGQLGRRIQAAIEDNETMLYDGSIPQQFQELLLKPSQGFVSERPLVIVLDALDEGSNADLLQILREDACHLPASIRIFLTSRLSPDIDILRRKPHVHSMDLDIYEQGNKDDITLFIRHKLDEVASYHDLGSGWPDQQLLASFQNKAEGLFLWAATTCEYLKTCDDPTDELQSLVSTTHGSESSAESRMDFLYTTILEACNWKSKSFVGSYHRLLGAAIATKTPLTLRALNALYQRVLASNPTLRQLSALLTGLSTDPQLIKPVQLLHQSLRDFLTLRAGSPNSPAESQRFAIVEESHSQTLALLCLQLMNRELNSSLPGVGYLENEGSVAEIPSISRGYVSDELWYACRFWVDHIQDVEVSTLPGILKELEDFLGARITVWMEISASHGRYEGLCKLQEWVNDELRQHPNILPLLYNERRASDLGSLAKHLRWMGRKEEAWIAARDQVDLNRKLAEATCNDAQVALSRSLCNLSIHLTDLGYLDEALRASEEAVTIHRTLKAQGVADFKADLARSLRRLSVGYSKLGQHEHGLEATQEAVGLQRQLVSGKDAAPESRFELATFLYSLQSNLYNLGRYDEALTTCQEAVDILREHAPEQRIIFAPELAQALRGLGADLSRLGRYREAEAATQESVNIYQQLASEHPAMFTADLADSFHNLSFDRSNLGHHEGALPITQEAVDLFRQLASECPAVFTSKLAGSLHNLSYDLSQLGRHEEALTTTQEEVDLYRQLASERPAVFTSDLADSLHNLSCDLFAHGRHQEALTVIQEAVQLFRPLAADRPAVLTPDLALALYQLSHCLSRLDDDQAAVVAIRESVELYRPLAEQYPATYTPKLSAALEDFALYLSYVGADEEAREIRQELGDSSSEEE